MDGEDFKERLEKRLGRKVIDFKIYGSEIVAILDNYQKVRVSVEDVTVWDTSVVPLEDLAAIDIEIYTHPEKFRRDELRAAAAAVGIIGAWQMKKAELVAELKARKK